MIRNRLKRSQLKKENGEFKLRGAHNTRIEALSDGVFALATALLIFSSSVPETYAELMIFLDDLIPFAICIVMLMLIWYQHYLFFIRYGFKDSIIVAVNGLLLFLILYFVYPLKFLFKLLYHMFPALVSNDHEKMQYLFSVVMPYEKATNLMIIYGLGAAGIFFTLAVMYFIAYKRREAISLTQLELFDTKASMWANIVMGIIPTLSFFISLLKIGGGSAFIYSGILYMSYAFIMPTFGVLSGKKRIKFVEELKAG